MSIENENDFKALQKVGKYVANILKSMSLFMEPGMTTKELDNFGAKLMEEKGLRSAPKLSYNFPGATCISVNEDIAHGIPGDRVINAGDLVNIDVSAELDGYFADTGASFIVPPAKKIQEKVCYATKMALKNAMNVAIAGNKLNKIGFEISRIARSFKLKTIDNLCSHGVGRSIHEYPKEITNYYDPYDQRILTDGLVITIEPFLSTNSSIVYEKQDGWTLTGKAGNIAAQYEHTMVINRNKPIILTIPD